MKKTRFSLKEIFPDDDSIAAEINRKLNLGQANKPCFFCELKSQYTNQNIRKTRIYDITYQFLIT
jgi:hypothetical protein